MWYRYVQVADRLECDLRPERGTGASANGCGCGGDSGKGEGRRYVVFIHSHDDVQRAVEEETALLGERRFEVDAKSGARHPLLEMLVMDGEYDNAFRRYFSEARSEILSFLPPRVLEDTPTDLRPVWLEGQDVRRDRDFILWLRLDKRIPVQKRKAIDGILLRYLVDYVCYRWLETKSPEDAQGYYVRLEDSRGKLRSMLSDNGGRVRRRPSWP